MRRAIAVLAVIVLSLAVVGQSWAGYTIKNRANTQTSSGQIVARGVIVKSITVYGAASGDKIAIYNCDISTGPTTTAELEFEVGISANTSTVSIPLPTDGIEFGNGIYIGSSSASSVVSAVYDY